MISRAFFLHIYNLLNVQWGLCSFAQWIILLPCFWSTPHSNWNKIHTPHCGLQDSTQTSLCLPLWPPLVPGGMKVFFPQGLHMCCSCCLESSVPILAWLFLLNFQISALNSPPGKPFLDALSNQYLPLLNSVTLFHSGNSFYFWASKPLFTTCLLNSPFCALYFSSKKWG